MCCHVKAVKTEVRTGTIPGRGRILDVKGNRVPAPHRGPLDQSVQGGVIMKLNSPLAEHLYGLAMESFEDDTAGGNPHTWYARFIEERAILSEEDRKSTRLNSSH